MILPAKKFPSELLKAWWIAVVFLALPCVVSAEEVPPDADEWFERALDRILMPEDETSAIEERHQILLERARYEGRIPVIAWLREQLIPEAALDAPGIQAQRDRLAAVQQRVLDRLSSAAYRNETELGLKRFVLTPALALQVDALDLEELLADPEVREIVEDVPLPPTLADSVPLIGADGTGAFSGYTGQGRVVAILDTGVDKNHPFLSGKVVSEACYSSNTANSTSLCPGGVTESTANNSGLDCDTSISGCGHGTHVTGIAAGSGGSFSGVAKDAGLIAIQVFSRFDSSSICSPSPAPCVLSWQSDQIKGLERVHALRTTYNIASANMSLGGGRFFSACDGQPQKPAIDNLRAAGIATAIASGNNGYTDSMGGPACISTAVSVGSTTKSDTVSSFSNSADFLDLLAPGSSINSSVPGGGFAFFNGTSMAAPHVAGAWAVLKEAEPGASVVDVLDALKNTGVSITDTRSGANNRVKPRIQVDDAVVALIGDPNLPGKPDALSPSGTVHTDQPAYSWNAVATATHYQLYVSDATATGVIDQEYSAAAVGCAGGGVCTVTPPVSLANSVAQWRVRAKNTFGYGFWSDTQSFQVAPALSNGVSVMNLSGSQDSVQFFHIEVPTGVDQLQVAISGGTGDADLYVRLGDLPTFGNYDCRPFLNGNEETCTFVDPLAGTYYIMLHGWSSYSGVTLVASYDSPDCPHEDDVVLQNTTVSGTEVHEACRTITAGPAYTVSATGNATFRAGERITLRPGFVVRSGGTFKAEIDSNLAP